MSFQIDFSKFETADVWLFHALPENPADQRRDGQNSHAGCVEGALALEPLHLVLAETWNLLRVILRWEAYNGLTRASAAAALLSFAGSLRVQLITSVAGV
jgi:hypothetical protein